MYFVYNHFVVLCSLWGRHADLIILIKHLHHYIYYVYKEIKNYLRKTETGLQWGHIEKKNYYFVILNIHRFNSLRLVCFPSIWFLLWGNSVFFVSFIKVFFFCVFFFIINSEVLSNILHQFVKCLYIVNIFIVNCYGMALLPTFSKNYFIGFFLVFCFV